MSAITLTLPADRIEWGQLVKTGPEQCQQTAHLFDALGLVCSVTVTWPTELPGVPVVCSSTPRHAGPQD